MLKKYFEKYFNNKIIFYKLFNYIYIYIYILVQDRNSTLV